MKSFLDWLNEIVQTDIHYPGGTPPEPGKGWSEMPPNYTQPQPTKRKDGAGFPILDSPGLRTADVNAIKRESPQVEGWLDKVTAKFGIHWIVLYMSPEAGTQSIDDPETSAAAVSVGKAKELGQPGWDQYKKYSQVQAKQRLDMFLKAYKEQGVLDSNTIVYIKPTSRVHTMKAWNQGHNIGHAIFGYAKEKGKRIFVEFSKTIRQIVYDLQQKAYLAAKTGNPKETGEERIAMPSAQEITIMLGRVLGTGASFRRMFTAGVDDETGATDFDKRSFRVNTALNSYEEAMFELIAAFINGGGRLPIQTQGAIKGTPVADRAGELDPTPGVVAKFKPRDYVWKALASDQAAWQEAAAKLEEIIGRAFHACTWAVQGGPIYSTTGYITTGA